VAKRVE
jgi:hypothetical protein